MTLKIDVIKLLKYLKDKFEELLEKPCVSLLSYLSILLYPIFFLESWFLIFAYISYIVILPFIIYKFISKKDGVLLYFLVNVGVYSIFFSSWLVFFMNPALENMTQNISDFENNSAIYKFIYSIIGTDFIVTATTIIIVLILLVTTAIPFIKYLFLYKKILEESEHSNPQHRL